MLNIDVTEENAGALLAVVSLDGELDAATYKDVIAKARDLAAHGTTNILLDLSRLTHMSSAGLFALYSVATMLRGEEPPDPETGWAAVHDAVGDKPSKHLKLLSPQPQVERVLHISGLSDSFTAFADRSVALASF